MTVNSIFVGQLNLTQKEQGEHSIRARGATSPGDPTKTRTTNVNLLATHKLTQELTKEIVAGGYLHELVKSENGNLTKRRNLARPIMQIGTSGMPTKSCKMVHRTPQIVPIGTSGMPNRVNWIIWHWCIWNT